MRRVAKLLRVGIPPVGHLAALHLIVTAVTQQVVRVRQADHRLRFPGRDIGLLDKRLFGLKVEGRVGHRPVFVSRRVVDPAGGVSGGNCDKGSTLLTCGDIHFNNSYFISTTIRERINSFAIIKIKILRYLFLRTLLARKRTSLQFWFITQSLD